MRRSGVVATWKQISLENLDAARLLYSGSSWRSATSRAYYAVFGAVTWRLPATAVAPNRKSPPHRDLLRLIDLHFDWLQWHQREAVKAAVARTYVARLDSDYRPTRTVDRGMAKRALQDSVGVLRRLGVDDGK